MARILLVFAKLNAGIRYVQGMHELLAPILYVFSAERGCATADAQAEADAFFCFMALMAECRDVFIKAHDHSDTGVRGVIGRYSALLRRREPGVAAHLAGMGLDPYFYVFRWLTTMLSREFPLPDVLSLWDRMLADPHRFAFLLHLCVGMVRLQRPAIMAADFGSCMRLLQSYPPADVLALTRAAFEIRAEDERDGVQPGPVHLGSPAPKPRGQQQQQQQGGGGAGGPAPASRSASTGAAVPAPGAGALAAGNRGGSWRINLPSQLQSVASWASAAASSLVSPTAQSGSQ
jgi:hypothetical protein